MDDQKQIETKHYEMLYVISNKFSENELPPIIERIKKVIEDKAGKITFTEEWGKKKLSYPIKGNIYGYYILHEFDIETGLINEVDRLLRVITDVIRYQIVSKEAVSEVARIKKTEEAREDIKKSLKEDKEISEPKAKTKKVDLKDLDEKLDKILDVDGLL
jgi:small subunit ribosomal protein S6